MKVKDLVPYLALAAFIVAAFVLVYVPTVVSMLVAVAALVWSAFCIDDLDKPSRRPVERTGYSQIDAWLNANFKDRELPERKVTTQWAKQRYAWLDETEPNAVTCLVSYFRDTLDSESLDSRLDANLKLGEYAGESKPHLVCEPVVEERVPTVRQTSDGVYSYIAEWNAHTIGLPPADTRKYFDTAVDSRGRNWQLLGPRWVSKNDEYDAMDERERQARDAHRLYANGLTVVQVSRSLRVGFREARDLISLGNEFANGTIRRGRP